MLKSYRPPIEPKRMCILAEGYLNIDYAKTASGVLRYRPEVVCCVIDSQTAGRSLKQMLGMPVETPIVANLQEALQYQPDCLLLGIATTGGFMPPEWKTLILDAINHKMHVISGLHMFLNDDPDLVKAAQQNGVTLWDVRQPPKERSVASMKAAELKNHTILAVGTDCGVGKMSAMIECNVEMKKRGYRSSFLPTGQTGILITGKGIPLDRIIGDFMAGAVEQMILEEADDADYLWVEGQGSVIHPGYSGVTLALIHGTLPEMMLMCHQADRKFVDDNPLLPYPPMDEFIKLHEQLVQKMRPTKFIGIAVNTFYLKETEAIAYLEELEKLTGLPTTDPVRFGAGKIVDSILKHTES